jgi:hypothetical protein
MARGSRCKSAKQRLAGGKLAMNRIGILGTSGTAREAGDIAMELGLELV